MQGAITDNASQNQFSPTGVQTSLQMKTADGIYLGIPLKLLWRMEPHAPESG